MMRRLCLLLFAAALLHANSAKDAWDMVRSMADALSSGSPEHFLEFFDRSMPGYDTLRNNVVGMLSQGGVGCNIEVTTNDGDDTERTLTLDWIFTLEPAQDSAGTKRWEKKAECRIRKIAGKWKVVSFTPLDLFQAPV